MVNCQVLQRCLNKVKAPTPKFSIFMNLWVQHEQVGYRVSQRWSRRQWQRHTEEQTSPPCPMAQPLNWLLAAPLPSRLSV